MLNITSLSNIARSIRAYGVKRAVMSVIITNTSSKSSKRMMAFYWRALSTKTRPVMPTMSATKTCVEKPVISSSSATDEFDKLYRNLDLEVRGHDPAVIRSYKCFILESAKHLDIPLVKTYEPTKIHDRRNKKKSVFGHGKHFVQYEARTYYQVIILENVTESTANTFLEYIERNIPEGVTMKVTKHEIQPLPEHLRERPSQLADS
ncbi:28S ribosomal protein S10 [Tropilaelaps mercedesae]|uniref:Small ribosomal subunit protein uS10m n=1 Tax=Tropilaelaps mercedesae TaxID=418985 RepID=A0A1V9X981_9ACAR|nr:28S ribosomal protein S10 [Tropilaelaps mercedesae]